ncbi:MAG: lipoate--protein ligase family protein [Gemmatimonadaceae bacterium]|nr:lipoate--protein ligase family protein [Gemmatimonadaceae bacterium]
MIALPEGSRWTLLLSPPLEGVENMALDEALMAHARTTGHGTVRVYSWASPTLSLGRNQRAIDAFPAVRASARGIAVVRRATGGRALLHHREITYSVTAPAPAHDSLTRSYRAINAVLLEALRTLGVQAQVAHGASRLPPPGSAPCFEMPAAGELTVGGRKLVGSAQYREQGAMLQHGSILVDDDQPLVTELAALPVPATSPAATLREALGRAPTPEEFAAALFGAVRAAWGPEARQTDVAPVAAADLLAARARYASDVWTWRR